ncbi:hypothetical protein FRB99_008268, partial [Tulasnella sp. 403]
MSEASSLFVTPTTSELHIFGNQMPFIQYLSAPTLINGTRDWPLPILDILTIQEVDNDPNEILRMVEGCY